MSMSMAEAKRKLSSVVERAASGDEITITRHGKPIAKVVESPRPMIASGRVGYATKW